MSDVKSMPKRWLGRYLVRGFPNKKRNTRQMAWKAAKDFVLIPIHQNLPIKSSAVVDAS